MSNTKLTKAQIIEIIVAAQPEAANAGLKKLTVKKLEAYAEDNGISLNAAPEEQAEQVLEGHGEIGDIQVKAGKETITLQEKADAVMEKDPTETNFYYAAVLSVLFPEMQWTAKHAQVVSAMWRTVQDLDINKVRPGFRGRSAESIVKAASTIVEKDDTSRLNGGPGYQSPNAPIATPEQIAEAVNAKLRELGYDPEPEEADDDKEAEQAEAAELAEELAEEFADA